MTFQLLVTTYNLFAHLINIVEASNTYDKFQFWNILRFLHNCKITYKHLRFLARVGPWIDVQGIQGYHCTDTTAGWVEIGTL